MKLIVIIPAFNEENNLPGVLKEIPRSIEGIDTIEVIVIDDGSKDKTMIKAYENGADEVITHKVNKGLGVTFRDGINAALERDADIIANIDADGQFNAGQISDLIRPILNERADVVIGYRDIDRLDFLPREKKIGNKLATWVTRRLSGLPIKDAQSGFRAFTRDAALRLNLFAKYTYVQETIIQASHKDLVIEQVPVECKAREGKSRLISNIGTYAWKASLTILSTYRDYKPLQLFSFIGGLFLLLGTGFGLRVLMHFYQTGMVTPYLPSAVLSSLLIIMGMMTILLGIFMHILNGQRRLTEEILYRMKKNGNGSIYHTKVSSYQGRNGKSSL